MIDDNKSHVVEKGNQPLREGYKPTQNPQSGNQPNTGQQKPFIPAVPPKNP